MPARPPAPREPTRLEVMLTAFGFPGVGQLVQRRWISAVSFLVLGLGLAAALVAEALVPVFHNLRVALSWQATMGDGTLTQPSIPRILALAGALLLVHVVSILDAAAAYRKRRLRWNQSQRHRPPPLPGAPTA